MNFTQSIDHIFSSQGEIAQAAPHYLPRAQQLEMAQAVADCIVDEEVLVVEAGTGVGKTFAYLTPVLLSGKRAMISTATKTLQDQLFNRDLPQLVAALKLPIRSALLKGRSSYLCTHRLDLARHDSGIKHIVSHQTLAKIEHWAQQTQTGDMSELEGLDENSPVLPVVTSTRENCLGSECPQYRACYVNLARKEAMAADVVVVNHHLFFADLMVRESGMAELLPSVQVHVFDEAHQMNETGIQFLGAQLGTAQVVDLAKDILAAGLQLAGGLQDWTLHASQLERAARDLRLTAGKPRGSGRLRWGEAAPEGIGSDDWFAALRALEIASDQAADVLSQMAESAPDFLRLFERATVVQKLCQLFQKPRDPSKVRWLDVTQQLRLVESPLDIGATVQERLLHAGEEERRKAWIFTSATLGDDDQLSWFTEPCGLRDARILRVGSPFDYSTQAWLYVPRPFAKPADAGHSEAVAKLALQAAQTLGGKTMVLTTTLRALREIGDILTQALASSDIAVLVQGHASKRELISRFQAPEQGGAVLVGSASFWEGVDVPGDALQVVIIDKLPFPPPGDPLVEARTQKIEAEGGSPFAQYHLAEAAVMLKQGAGRLIRRESDRGILIVCDPRLTSMGYGHRLRRSLPPMQLLATHSAFEAALNTLKYTT